MAKLNLDLGEKIIMEAPRGVVPQDDEKAQKYYASLLLTNKALYIQYLSIWTRALKETRRIPLNMISIYEGEAQVHVRRAGIYYSLVLFTKNETFEFVMAGSNKNEVKRWVDSISRLLTGHDSVATVEGRSLYSDTLKDILNVFKNENKEADAISTESQFVENKDDGKTDIDEQIEMIKSLKELLDAGALTQEEFDRKKREVLGI